MDDDPPPSPFILIIAGIVGIMATVANLFILSVFLFNKLNYSYLLITLSAAHLINGVIHICVGFWPKYNLELMVPPMFCFKVVWPAVYIAIYQFLPIILVLNAIERLLGVGAPIWYHAKGVNEKLLYVAVGSWGLYALLFAGNQLKIAMNPSDQLTPAYCVPPLIFGVQYMLFLGHGLAAGGGLTAALITGAAVYTGRRRLAKMQSSTNERAKRMTKQVRLTISLMVICCLDVLCVVIPNIILILHVQGAVYIPRRYTVHPTIIYCSDSVWNIFAFLLFNNDFRKAASSWIHCKRKVQPITTDPGGQRNSQQQQQGTMTTRRVPAVTM